MRVEFNRTRAERKALVTAIAEILRTKPKYMGMPTASYDFWGGLSLIRVEPWSLKTTCSQRISMTSCISLPSVALLPQKCPTQPPTAKKKSFARNYPKKRISSHRAKAWGSGCQWQPLAKQEAPTESADETLRSAFRLIKSQSATLQSCLMPKAVLLKRHWALRSYP